ncbi:hypothetical protein TYRP_016202, partial [Tyrophagus putrescentiae]
MSGQAAHPDVTWPLSTPSSSGLARCARETLVVAKSRQTSPPCVVHCFPCNSGAPPAAQGENGSNNAQPKSQDFRCSCCDSVPRLRTAAKASATSAKTKDNVPNFLGFLVNHK